VIIAFLPTFWQNNFLIIERERGESGKRGGRERVRLLEGRLIDPSTFPTSHRR